MGNANGVVKVLSINVRLTIYTRKPVKAAEIMLENPGQFLCESSCLKVGQRVPGICAEKELERGRVYFLLPMEMLYSVLTNEEMKCLRQRASKGIKQAAFKISKIFPEFHCLFPSTTHVSHSEAKAVEDYAAVDDDGDSHNVEKYYSRQRSWQPALETIVETPPHTYN